MNNKILFDGIATQGTLDNPFHGGGEYAKFVLKEAINHGYKFDVVFRTDLITDDEILSLLHNSGCQIVIINNNSDLYSLVEEKEYTTFYSALPYNYTDYSIEKTKFIQVIHGLRSIELPWDYYRFKYYNGIIKKILARIISVSSFLQHIIKKRNIQNIRKLISISNSIFFTVSEHSKYSLLLYFPFLKAQNISVFYSPFDMSPFQGKKNPTNEYYLMVNGNRFEKNIYRAVLAIDKLISSGQIRQKKIIITGSEKLPFYHEIINKESFILLPYVSKEKLEELYQNAFAFIYPSLNEGFGYPPLKAMNFGVPVIASSSSSISEVCGNAALYFNPLSLDEIGNRILQIEYSDSIRTELINNGYTRVKTLYEKQTIEMKGMLRFIFEND